MKTTSTFLRVSSGAALITAALLMTGVLYAQTPAGSPQQAQAPQPAATDEISEADLAAYPDLAEIIRKRKAQESVVVQQLDKEPQVLNSDNIRQHFGFPDAAYAAQASGDIVVVVNISPEGKYLSHQIQELPHEAWRIPVDEALPSLRFTPGMYQGQGVKCSVTLKFPMDYQAEHSRREQPKGRKPRN